MAKKPDIVLTKHSAWQGATSQMIWEATTAAMLRLANVRGMLQGRVPPLWLDTQQVGEAVSLVAEPGHLVAFEAAGIVGWAFVHQEGFGAFYAFCTPREREIEGLGAVEKTSRIYNAAQGAAERGTEASDWVWWANARKVAMDGPGKRLSRSATNVPGVRPAAGRAAVLSIGEGDDKRGVLCALGSEADKGRTAGSKAWMIRPRWQKAWDELVASGKTVHKSQTVAMWAVIQRGRALNRRK